MKVFLPVAIGPYAERNGVGRIISRICYISRQRAEAAADSFKAACVRPKDKTDCVYLDSRFAKVQLVELEIDLED